MAGCYCEEFLCGWGAALINTTVTYPLYKIIFRQMLHGIQTKNVIVQLKNEGMRYLYRGISLPLCQKTVSVSVMFGMYKEYQNILLHIFPNFNPVVNRGIAAAMAGYTEAVLTPFERIQTLMQDKAYHERFQNSFHTFKILKSYGLKEYYRGLTPILLRNSASNVLFFELRGKLKNVFPPNIQSYQEIAIDFIDGAILGAIISTMFYPFNVIKIKMQCNLGGEFPSFFATAQMILIEREYSCRKLYAGVHINYTRALISWGIINASYEMLKKLFNYTFD